MNRLYFSLFAVWMLGYVVGAWNPHGLLGFGVGLLSSLVCLLMAYKLSDKTAGSRHEND